MTQVFSEEVQIDGSADLTQLAVQGHSHQTAPLQSWDDSTGEPLARISGDGRLQIGSFDAGMMATDDALIEAHRAEADVSKPKRGLHLLGEVSGVLDNIVSWAVQELVLKGTGGISALHSALRVRLTNENSGSMASGAELRAADVEVVNAGGRTGSPVPEMTGITVKVNNAQNGHVDRAYGIKVDVTNEGSLNKAYALYAQDGSVFLGQDLEMKLFDAAPAHVPDAGVIQVYPRLEAGVPKLFAKDAADMEYSLSGDELADDVVTLAKLAHGTPNKLIGYDATGVPVETDPPAITSESEEGLLHLYDTAGGLTIATTPTILTFDTVAKLGTDFQFTGGGTEVTFNANRWYEITYYVSTDITTGVNRSETNVHLEEDTGTGFVAVPGTQSIIYNRILGQGGSNASVTILRQYQAGDRIRLSAAKVGADTIKTVANGVGLTVRDATRTGPKGETGATGAPGANGSGDDLPVASVTAFAGGTLPNGWLLCDGSEVSRSTYSALFTTVGEIYGAGDGVTTFNLPDLRGRVAIGAGQGNGLTIRLLGETLGEEEHQLTVGEMPLHNHSVSGWRSGSNIDPWWSGTRSFSTATGSKGGDLPHNNMQPSLVLNYIIKT